MSTKVLVTGSVGLCAAVDFRRRKTCSILFVADQSERQAADRDGADFEAGALRALQIGVRQRMTEVLAGTIRVALNDGVVALFDH
jgi:hypothetical protein